MHEGVKTVIYAAVAAAVALIAFWTYPRQEEYKPPERLGKALFEGQFEDPSAATDLRIVKFSEDLGELSEFEVARDADGLWTIPSSANYPADAETQMRDAATSLIGLQVLGVASSEQKDHQLYGVIAPDQQKLDASQEGVGLLVTVKDTKGKELASLIVGKLVKGTEDQRFVRIPNQNPVYVVKIDPAKFPTEFEKWIERDLLKINTFDVERVTLKDYSITTTQTLSGPRGRLDERFEAGLKWSSDQSKWVLNELVEVRGGERKPTELLPTEELNTQKLNDLKTALGDMKIVGVLRKPTGLGADLQAGNEFLNNEESVRSLMQRGFFPVTISGGEPEIRAANGEVLVGLKDGVEYVLRFGEIESVAQDSEEGKLNRYLFVSARINQDSFPPLELEPLPGGEEEEAPKEEAPKEEAPKEEAPKEEAKSEGGEEAKKDESTAAKSDLELERERIRKENQRKQDERDEKLKKANQKIAELNARFADWYYIIAEDEYKKVHLGRNDLIKEKASAMEEGFGVDSLRQLEQEGLEEKKKDDAATPPPSSFQPPTGPRQ